MKMEGGFHFSLPLKHQRLAKSATHNAARLKTHRKRRFFGPCPAKTDCNRLAVGSQRARCNHRKTLHIRHLRTRIWIRCAWASHSHSLSTDYITPTHNKMIFQVVLNSTGTNSLEHGQNCLQAIPTRPSMQNIDNKYRKAKNLDTTPQGAILAKATKR